MSVPLDLTSPSLVVVSGASRGLGLAIARRFAEKMSPGSHMILMARDQKILEERCCEICSINSGVTTYPISLELTHANYEEVKAKFDEASKAFLKTSFKSTVIVHNAATLGDFTKTSGNFTDKRHLDDFWSLNLSSVCLLNSYWLENPLLGRQKLGQMFVVNLSSLLAVKAFKTLSLYAASKAARDMLFQVLALEYPDVAVLNYAPGPLDTDMQKALREDTQDAEMRAIWAGMHEKSQLISPNVSALVLLKLLLGGNYDNAAHVDVFDVWEKLLSDDERKSN